MSKVTADVSMSLDGFIAGPGDDVHTPLGVNGERLHQWMYDVASWRASHGLAGGKSNRDSEVVDEAMKTAGAFVMGRRMFDLGERYWGHEPPFHAPVFVVTHDARPRISKDGGTTYNFVSDGLESAVDQARKIANGKDVSISGGASLIQQGLNLKLLDEIQIHLVPLVLTEGRALFDTVGHVEMKPMRVIHSEVVTHLKYSIVYYYENQTR